MFLLKILRIFLLSMGVLGAQGAHALTQWVKMVEGDRRCSMTCGRSGLDNVISTKTPLGDSVCAGRSKDNDKLLPGVQRFNGNLACQIASGDSVPTDCLCSNDGVERGTDLIWLEPLAQGRCDTTCKAQGVISYGYAVYSSYVHQSWAHVCMAGDGSIGFTGGGKTGCQTNTGATNNFKCLCTKGFAGDLETRFNP